MDIDPLTAILRAAHGNRISLLHIAELHNGDGPIPAYRHAVHAALLGQHPPPVQAEILGEHGGGVILLRYHAVPLRRDQLYIGGVPQTKCGKIRGLIDRKGKTHRWDSSSLLVLFLVQRTTF